MVERESIMDKVGARLSTRVADVASRAVIDTKLRSAGYTRKVALSILDELFRVMDSEARAALNPWLKDILTNPDLPAEIRPLLSAIATPSGQWQMFVAGSATGAVMAGGLSQLLADLMAPAILPIIANHPNLPLSADVAAQAEARGVHIGLPPDAEAARAGLNGDRFDGLVELNRRVPELSEILTLYNRRLVTGKDAQAMMRRLGLSTHNVGLLFGLARTELTPEQLADLVNFGVLTEADAVSTAHHSGMSTEDFHRLVLGAGQPPALDAVILAWRRGILTEADVDRAIVQGPIRAEWIPAVKALQHEPLPLTEAADAVNQGHLTREQAERVAKLHGVSTEDFGVIVDNAGIPPGPQTVLDWVNRGLLTEREALDALYESRIKNKWVPKYLQSRYETIPPETIRVLMRHGALSTEEGVRRLQLRGLSPADAAVYAQSATAEKTQEQRSLSVAQVLELYVDQALSADEAGQVLSSFGYDEHEIGWQLVLADSRRLRRYQVAILNRIRTAYVARRMDEVEASGLMDEIGITPNERDGSILLWDIERATISKGLTTAQITSAYKRGLIDRQAALDRHMGDGYSPDDAEILIKLAEGK